jgi:hypothetical protein
MNSNFLHRIFGFLNVSHRWSHLVGGFTVGLVFGFDVALCVAATLEWKDCQHDRLNAPYGLDCRKWIWRCWDWTDFTLTVAGGVLGSLIRWWVIGRFM